MKRHVFLLVAFVTMATLVISACGGGAPKVDWEVRITGAVSNPLTLTYKDLAKRDAATLKDVLMRRSQGEDTVNTWEGPPLSPILEEAGLSGKATGVLCTAADGYAREMALPDLQDAIVALKVDGEWIATDEKGPIRLVVPNKPANHWLFQLVEIQVVE